MLFVINIFATIALLLTGVGILLISKYLAEKIDKKYFRQNYDN